MLFRPIKALFKAILRFIVSATILVSIYIATTGNTQLIAQNLQKFQSMDISKLSTAGSQLLTLLKNTGIIKVINNEQTNTQRTQTTPTISKTELPKEPTETATALLTATPKEFILNYPNDTQPIYISYKSKIKTTPNIFDLKDYTPVKLNINVKDPVTLHCKILSSKSAKELGYMYKPSIGDYECLIFTFKEPTNTPFHMKNVNFSLDIIFLNSKLKVISVVHSAPSCKNSDCPLYFPPTAYRVAIEMKGGNWKKFVGK